MIIEGERFSRRIFTITAEMSDPSTFSITLRASFSSRWQRYLWRYSSSVRGRSSPDSTRDSRIVKNSPATSPRVRLEGAASSPDSFFVFREETSLRAAVRFVAVSFTSRCTPLSE